MLSSCNDSHCNTHPWLQQNFPAYHHARVDLAPHEQAMRRAARYAVEVSSHQHRNIRAVSHRMPWVPKQSASHPLGDDLHILIARTGNYRSINSTAVGKTSRRHTRSVPGRDSPQRPCLSQQEPKSFHTWQRSSPDPSAGYGPARSSRR